MSKIKFYCVTNKKVNFLKVVLLTANKNYSKIIKQINIFKPRVVIIYNEKVYLRVKKK